MGGRSSPCRFGLAAFGFVLEQDLSDVEFEEFLVPLDFAPQMYPLSDIADMAGIVFPKVVADADQFETVRGSEVAVHAGTKRKRRDRNGQVGRRAAQVQLIADGADRPVDVAQPTGAVFALLSGGAMRQTPERGRLHQPLFRCLPVALPVEQ